MIKDAKIAQKKKKKYSRLIQDHVIIVWIVHIQYIRFLFN